MTYHNTPYFEQNKDQQFIVELFAGRLQIARLIFDSGAWWFNTSIGKIKATTTQCMPLNELGEIRLGESKGKGTEYGISKTPFVGIYWNIRYKRDTPNHYFWNDINKLQYENKTGFQR